MNKIKSVGILIALVMSSYAFGNNELSYVDGTKPFLLIKDLNRQADAWGTCAATYEVMSILLMESSPAQAKQYQERGNGSAIAIVMTHVSDGLSSDMTQARFNSLWSLSKTLATSIPETKRTMILADAERLGASGSEKFIGKVVTTIEICMSNLEGQQNYIDKWRELAKSGLLAMPNK